MRALRRLAGALLAACAVALAASPTAGANSFTGQKSCELGPNGRIGTATPAQVGLDAEKLRRAIEFASGRNRLSVRVYRNDCLVATSDRDALSERIPNQIWSSTKSVISILAGIAYDQGKLDLNAPIGRYLPRGPQWGDRAHRRIKVRHLLTETAGLKQSIISEGATVGSDPNIAKQALALPLVSKPGARFEYSQRTPDLLAFVVSRAVGADLQSFAQRRLFDPIGIDRDAYFWLRDRAGNSYGYANLFLAPQDLARIGLLLENQGSWGERQVLSRGYVAKMRTPSPRNNCYALLTWLNRGDCISPSIFSRRKIEQRIIAPAPRDAFATVGAFQQNNFVIPSLDVVVTWTGEGGDLSTDPQTTVSANPHSELYWEFFRRFGRAVEDERIPDPGPYVDDPANEVRPFEFIDPGVLANGLGLGPTAPPNCNVLFCGRDDLSTGPRANLAAALLALATAARETIAAQLP